jgi:hypothetical protein
MFCSHLAVYPPLNKKLDGFSIMNLDKWDFKYVAAATISCDHRLNAYYIEWGDGFPHQVVFDDYKVSIPSRTNSRFM